MESQSARISAVLQTSKFDISAKAMCAFGNTLSPLLRGTVGTGTHGLKDVTLVSGVDMEKAAEALEVEVSIHWGKGLEVSSWAITIFNGFLLDGDYLYGAEYFSVRQFV